MTAVALKVRRFNAFDSENNVCFLKVLDILLLSTLHQAPSPRTWIALLLLTFMMVPKCAPFRGSCGTKNETTQREKFASYSIHGYHT